ncbi:MAG: hypothetical protein RLY93_13870 [Sumerlaeia bacterium]
MRTIISLWVQFATVGLLALTFALSGCAEEGAGEEQVQRAPAASAPPPERDWVAIAEGIDLGGKGHLRTVPRLVIWPAFDNSLAPEDRQRLVFLRAYTGSQLMYNPEPVLEVYLDDVEWVFLPAKASKEYRPLTEQTDAELAEMAWAAGAPASLKMAASSPTTGSLELELTLLGRGGDALAQTALSGPWEIVAAEYGVALAPVMTSAFDEVWTATAFPVERLDRDHIEALLGYADLVREEGDAKSYLREWRRWSPRNPYFEPYLLVNEAMEASWVPDAVEPLLRESLAADPPNAAVLAQLASSFRTDAFTPMIWGRLNMLYPGWKVPVDGLAATYGGTDQRDKILEWNARRIAMSGSDGLRIRASGKAIGELASKIQDGRVWAEIPPEDHELVSQCRTRAFDLLTSACAMLPNHVRLHDELGWAANAVGRTDLALLHHQRSRDLDPDYQYPIVGMLWACAPGYTGRREQGLQIFRDNAETVTDPYTTRAAIGPLMQIMLDSMRPRIGDILKDYEPDHVWDVWQFGRWLLITTRIEEPGPEQSSQLYWGLWYHEFREIGIEPALLDTARHVYFNAKFPNPQQKAETGYMLAHLIEMAGDLEAPEALYEGAIAESALDYMQRATLRLLILQVKRGELAIEEALPRIDAVAAPDWLRALSRVEVLQTGGAADRARGLEEARALFATRQTHLPFLHLLRAESTAGNHARVRDLMREHFDTPRLYPPFDRFWREARAGLGESTAWPPEGA